VLLLWQSLREKEVLERVNSFFEDHGTRGLVHIREASPARPDWYGGNKALQLHVAIGAFDALNIQAFFDHLRETVQWTDDDYFVQVVLQDEDDNGCCLVTIYHNQGAGPLGDWG